jgi:DNA topoisomerase-1
MEDIADDKPLAELIGLPVKVETLPLSAANTNNNHRVPKQNQYGNSPPSDQDDELPLAQLIKFKNEAQRAARRHTGTKRGKSKRAAFEKKKNERQKVRRQHSKITRGFHAEDETIKWTTLEHNGVLFPPEYVPHRRPLIYRGAEVSLPSEAEEIATFYAAKLGTDYVTKETFRKNFFEEFRRALPKNLKELIVKLDDCDFSHIRAHLDELKEQKQSMPASKRKELREAEAKRVAPYTMAIVDGRIEKVANFRVEPPGLFLGRGDHPLMGRLKRRIEPEDVTLNLGKGAPIPPCPSAGRRWGSIVHNQKVTWLACWRDPISDEYKYVWLNAASHFKAMSDQEKFEKAQQLSKHITRIRKEYIKDFGSSNRHIQQRSVALYLIDKLALRVGNEKGDDEADTVGCCSLRVEHVQLQEPNVLQLDFLGKDSMRYFNKVSIDPRVFRRLQELLKGKKPAENVFDELKVDELNDYLKSLMPGLSAKVFRTYNASFTLDRILNSAKNPGPDIHSRILFYNEANKDVAILCNHQRSLPKTHSSMVQKVREQLEETQTFLEELKRAKEDALKSTDQRAKVTRWRRPAVEIPPDCPPAERKRIREEAAKKPLEKHVCDMGLTSILRSIAQTQEKILRLQTDLKTKDSLATVSLSTSKINYLDPRITVAWCKRHEVPVERIFPRALQEKFRWSMSASEDFRFPLNEVSLDAP